MCELFQVSRSGYYAFLKRPVKKAEEVSPLIQKVKEIHDQTGGVYGSRRMSAQLKKEGFQVGRYLARKLMKLAKVQVSTPVPKTQTTDSSQSKNSPENLLKRQFDVQEPNQVWVGDITYIWTLEGWCYLAMVMDLFSRKIIGWAVQGHMETQLVVEALQMAKGRRTMKKGLMFHSDQGSQYTSDEFQEFLKQSKITSSLSRKGNCYDNAVAERFFHTLKDERVYHKIYRTIKEAKENIVEYIEMFYNSMRLHSYLGYLSPNEFEESVQLS